MREMTYKDIECVVKKTTYSNNGNLALLLIEKGTDEVVATITTNTSTVLPERVAVVKDYSENEGMLEAIFEAGLVAAMLGNLQTGHVMSPVIMFHLDYVEELDKND